MPIKVLTSMIRTVRERRRGDPRAADDGSVITLSSAVRLKSRILEDAVEQALSKALLSLRRPVQRARVGWPASYPGVVAVSAPTTLTRIPGFRRGGQRFPSGARRGLRINVFQRGRAPCEEKKKKSSDVQRYEHGVAARVRGAVAMSERFRHKPCGCPRRASGQLARPMDELAPLRARIWMWGPHGDVFLERS